MDEKNNKKNMQSTKLKKIMKGTVFLVLIISVFTISKSIGSNKLGNEVQKMKEKGILAIEIKSPVEQKELKQDGYSIYYYAAGNKDKELIIFLHPAFADHRCFDAQIDYFSKNYRVITIDMLGHGLSQLGEAKDKIDLTANHIDAILKLEGYNKAHFVGVSMGTYLAQYFALKYPEKVLSMTMVGGLDINVNNEEVIKAQRSEQVKWMVRALFSMNSFRSYVSKNVVSKLQEQARFYEMASLFKRKSFRVMSGLVDVLQEREKVTIDYPLLFLCGDKDIDLTKKISKEWHESEPSSEYFIIKNAGHCANMDNSEDFNRIVLDFIKKKEKRVQ